MYNSCATNVTPVIFSSTGSPSLAALIRLAIQKRARPWLKITTKNVQHINVMNGDNTLNGSVGRFS